MNGIANNVPCPHCGRFANRGLSIDAVIIKDNQVLLIKRGVEPDKGLWGMPGGYVEWDESPEEAVAREVREETGLIVTSTKLVGVFGSPTRHPKQVVTVVYAVAVKDGPIHVGDDAEDAQWFPLDQLPARLAFDHQQNIEAALNPKS